MSELLNGFMGFMGNQNRIIREGYQSRINGLSLVPNGGSISESRRVLNAFNLPGRVGVFNLDKPQTRLCGNATEVDVDKQVTLDADCYISGVAFVGAMAMTGDALVGVGETGRVVFANCLFFRGDDAGSGPFVNVADGGTVVFNGCGFISASTVQNAVNLGPSPVANGIRFVGCSKGDAVTNYGVPVADVVGCLS